MSNTLWLALGSAAASSMVSLIGILTLTWNEKRISSLSAFMIRFAAGAMLGNAFLHLLPEAVESAHAFAFKIDVAGLHLAAGGPLVLSALGLAGFFAFLALDTTLQKNIAENDQQKSLGFLLMLADGVENFMDGIVIGAAYLVNPLAGIATTIAIIAHEIPLELADFMVLLKSGFTRRQALLFNFLSGLAAVAGAAITVFIGAHVQSFSQLVAPAAAGAFLYVSGVQLLPRILSAEDGKQPWRMLHVGLGIALMALLLLVE